jgi:membrane protein DedA with SNARE-associated domain
MNSELFKQLALPLFLLVFFGTLYCVWLALGLPPEETITPIARDYFERFGHATILISALVEGLFVIGWYFPGSTIIVACLVVATSSVSSFSLAALSAGIGLLTAYSANYAIGKFGWYRLLVKFGLESSITNARARLGKYGLAAILLTYWQFGLASAISTASGILQFPFIRFFLMSLVSVVLWTTFWSLIIYFLGAAAMQLVGFRFIIIIVLGWIAVSLAFAFIRRQRAKLR